MLLERRGQFRTLGVGHRDEVLDPQGVEHLATEALRSHTRTDALACGVHRSCGAGRATADDQDVEGLLGPDLVGLTRLDARVELRHDLLEAHPALAEHLTIAEHRRHRHHLASVDLALEQRTVDGDVADLRVEYAHQVQCLNDVRAVLAGEREVGLEPVLTIQLLHLLDDVLGRLRRMASHLQQGEDQRGELVAQRDACEAHRDVGAEAMDRERRASLIGIGTGMSDRDRVRERGDLVQETVELSRLRAFVEGGDQLDRVQDLLEVAAQLGGECSVEHRGSDLADEVE